MLYETSEFGEFFVREVSFIYSVHKFNYTDVHELNN